MLQQVLLLLQLLLWIAGNITGAAATFTGNVTIGGVLTYQDVTNIDALGIGTFREGIFLPDNKKAEFGNHWFWRFADIS